MDKDKSNRFMQKVVGDVATAIAAGLMVVGDKAGLFKAMAGAGPLAAAELAERSGVRQRYVEEWLAAMAGGGYVEYDAASDRFTLPDEHAQFLTNPDSEYYLGGLFGSLPSLCWPWRPSWQKPSRPGGASRLPSLAPACRRRWR